MVSMSLPTTSSHRSVEFLSKSENWPGSALNERSPRACLAEVKRRRRTPPAGPIVPGLVGSKAPPVGESSVGTSCSGGLAGSPVGGWGQPVQGYCCRCRRMFVHEVARGWGLHPTTATPVATAVAHGAAAQRGGGLPLQLTNPAASSPPHCLLADNVAEPGISQCQPPEV
ncbi:uncharacterized protein LOC119435342 [Dermacentor silvarum]|uniref:uncharacterized protein LOC119435342 n=1 Tax=Dermacentor silvarum TaxID=543639 RepID=UPI001898D80C|nr:uncharacterized protein LOC119435342 [Dermacentor silvarum]XP_049515762.1 uncharacterized protein LOC119435342 [Dermacentor silvarum]